VKGNLSLNYEFEDPFASIESAQEYLTLLLEAVAEVKQGVQSDILETVDTQYCRRHQALQLVLYNLQKLDHHLKSSHRILNDLRTLRRLLLNERHPSVPKPSGSMQSFTSADVRFRERPDRISR
jgi:hypothetical protein